jgi:uncharacterized protein (DUF302 family)
MSNAGLIVVPSKYAVKELVDRVEAELRARSITVFARIDHAAGASAAGMSLRPTVVIIFGNPKAGTPLMQANQTIGIDLPLKFLAWEDADKKVWLAYNDVSFLADRHGLKSESGATIAALSAVSAQIANAATA